MHATGAVVGDLNESNVLVDASANVALVDCDSFQIIDDDGVLHACPVGKPEFTPPELHGIELADGQRHPSADVFALSVLVSLLLREGRHPFAGVWTGRGDPPDLAACARRRRLPHPRGALQPSPLAVPWSALPSSLQRLSRRSLTTPRSAGDHAPAGRVVGVRARTGRRRAARLARGARTTSRLGGGDAGARGVRSSTPVCPTRSPARSVWASPPARRGAARSIGVSRPQRASRRPKPSGRGPFCSR